MVEQLVFARKFCIILPQLHFGSEEEIEAFFFIFRFPRRIIFAERDPKAFILCTPSTPTPAFFSFSAHFFPYSPRGFPSLSLRWRIESAEEGGRGPRSVSGAVACSELALKRGGGGETQKEWVLGREGIKKGKLYLWVAFHNQIRGSSVE